MTTPSGEFLVKTESTDRTHCSNWGCEPRFCSECQGSRCPSAWASLIRSPRWRTGWTNFDWRVHSRNTLEWSKRQALRIKEECVAMSLFLLIDSDYVFVHSESNSVIGVQCLTWGLLFKTCSLHYPPLIVIRTVVCTYMATNNHQLYFTKCHTFG